MKKPDSPLDFRQWLAVLDDEKLSELLQFRPDTVLPLPPGIGALAARLQLRASISRALATLSTTDLLVLEAVAELGGETTPVTAPEVVEFLKQRTGAPVGIAIEKLRSYGLLYGDDAVMMLPEVMAALPQGWQLLPDEQLPLTQLAEMIADLPARSKKILDTLAQSGGTGITKDAAADADPTRPIPQLIAQGLLIRIDESTVRLPQVVRAHLLGWHRPPLEQPPAITVGADALAVADNAGISAGLEVVRLMRLLLQELGTRPVSTLKGGGIGVRMISRLTKALDTTEDEVARLMCLGQSAQLVARGVPEPLPEDDDGGDYYAPTPKATEWLASALDVQYRVLLEGWRVSDWSPWRLGELHEKSKVQLLAPEMRREHLAELRELLIDSYESLPQGCAVDTPYDLFAFRHPLATLRLSENEFAQLWQEASWIGAFAHGALTSAVRTGRIDVPEAVEQLIVQADLTILAPGPLTPAAQQFMEKIAELESSGLASVFRLTESSVRRALDSGLTASDIITRLTALSVMELPQAVGYLVDDVARRHGSLRGGPALSYLRCDDPALLAQAVATVGEEAAMRLVAPTVAISQAPLMQVITRLRHHGFQPVAEDAFGISINLAPEPARVPQPPERQAKQQLDPSHIEAAVQAIRRSDTAKDAVATGTRTPASEVLTTLQSAARSGRTVTLGFVDKQGVAVHRVVRPVTVAAGLVDAIDATTGSVHRFQIHRITEVLVQ